VTAANAQRGRTARTNGAATEGWVHGLLEAHRVGGQVAWWAQTGPVTRYVGKGAALRIVAVSPGACDVVGALADGRVLVVEIKHGSRVWRSRAEAGARRDPVVADAQRARLDATARCGGAAYLAVDLSGHRALIPWASVPWSADGSLDADKLIVLSYDKRKLSLG